MLKDDWCMGWVCRCLPQDAQSFVPVAICKPQRSSAPHPDTGWTARDCGVVRQKNACRSTSLPGFGLAFSVLSSARISVGKCIARTTRCIQCDLRVVDNLRNISCSAKRPILPNWCLLVWRNLYAFCLRGSLFTPSLTVFPLHVICGLTLYVLHVCVHARREEEFVK